EPLCAQTQRTRRLAGKRAYPWGSSCRWPAGLGTSPRRMLRDVGSCRVSRTEADGPTVLAHACKMGLEGIVSKRKTSTYRSGRSPDWLKSKNPACEALRREEEEDWGR